MVREQGSNGHTRASGVILSFLQKEYVTNYSDPVTFAVKLTDSYGNPIEGVEISFYVVENGGQFLIGSNTTQQSGEAYFLWPQANKKPGKYNISAVARCNSEYVEAVASLIINKEATKIIMSDVKAQYTDNVTVRAKLLTDDDEAIPSARLKLNIVLQSKIVEIANNLTGSNGIAVFTFPTVKEGLWDLRVGCYDMLVVF